MGDYGRLFDDLDIQSVKIMGQNSRRRVGNTNGDVEGEACTGHGLRRARYHDTELWLLAGWEGDVVVEELGTRSLPLVVLETEPFRIHERDCRPEKSFGSKIIFG